MIEEESVFFVFREPKMIGLVKGVKFSSELPRFSFSFPDKTSLITDPKHRKMAPPPSPVRWGILSTGKVAQDFCVALKKIFKDDPSIGAIVAVGSRSLDTAQQFATRFNVSQAYGSYEELVNAPDVDIIYIASPHSHHYEHALLAMRANKNIICEKALTLSAAQAEILVQEARTRKLFFMEAVWTRYFPLIQNVFGRFPFRVLDHFVVD